jgi:hypothetical protein
MHPRAVSTKQDVAHAIEHEHIVWSSFSASDQRLSLLELTQREVLICDPHIVIPFTIFIAVHYSQLLLRFFDVTVAETFDKRVVFLRCHLHQQPAIRLS